MLVRMFFRRGCLNSCRRWSSFPSVPGSGPPSSSTPTDVSSLPPPAAIMTWDLEATCGDVNAARAIEVAVYDPHSEEHFASLIRPCGGECSTPEARGVHRIPDSEVEAA
eukprot:Hpha_TRINITY_DN19517_c0_g1::TRINITY_DN19517_c0_g1_i1::g.33533::m.33533